MGVILMIHLVLMTSLGLRGVPLDSPSGIRAIFSSDLTIVHQYRPPKDLGKVLLARTFNLSFNYRINQKKKRQRGGGARDFDGGGEF